MTKEDVEREIGRAYIEHRELEKKIACLRLRLRTVGRACTALADNVHHDDSEETIVNATDPREDFAELKKALAKLDELSVLLR